MNTDAYELLMAAFIDFQCSGFYSFAFRSVPMSKFYFIMVKDQKLKQSLLIVSQNEQSYDSWIPQ